MLTPLRSGLTAAFALSMMGQAGATITVWPESAGGNGHGYEVVFFETLSSSTSTWDHAKLLAERRGGYLATVTSAEENAFVSNLILDPSYWRYLENGYGTLDFWDGPWIGGFQDLPRAIAEAGSLRDPSVIRPSEPDGGWYWVTDEGFEYSGWHPEQPDDLYGGATDQNRLHYWDKGEVLNFEDVVPTWDDVRPGTYWIPSYVVEYDAVPEPALPVLLLGGLLALTRQRRRPH